MILHSVLYFGLTSIGYSLLLISLMPKHKPPLWLWLGILCIAGGFFAASRLGQSAVHSHRVLALPDQASKSARFILKIQSWPLWLRVGALILAPVPLLIAVFPAVFILVFAASWILGDQAGARLDQTSRPNSPAAFSPPPTSQSKEK